MRKTSTTFREVIDTYYNFRRNLADWNDFYNDASDFLSTIILASNNQFLESLSLNNKISLCERLVFVIDGFPSAFPYGESNSYASQVNKLDGQQHLDGYYNLWKDSNKIFLGSFFPYGINGPRKDIKTNIYLDSTNANLLVDIKTMTKNQEKVARFCFADRYSIYVKRPRSVFVQSITNDIENIIFTDRFDPFHTGRDSKDDHTNNFPQHSSPQMLELFNKYFQSTAKTPHLHFYFESVCAGDVIPTKDGHQPKGNDKSLAINLGGLSQYINDLCIAIKSYDNTQPLPAILKYDLGMPYLSILYGSTAFNDSYFISKIKRLPNLDDAIKRDILGKLSATKFLKLNLQFFAKGNDNLPIFPKEAAHIKIALKQLKQLSIAYKFIDDNAERLTSGQQRSLVSAINDGLNQHQKIYLESNNEKDFNENREDDFEPIL
ncbi:MAG: hypothetical protein E7379_03220 [Clostridiales bacterium]|nr:hypothetical protein [Clostridiales bacterium]